MDKTCYCGPEWLKRKMKIIPLDVCEFFCPCCELHDRHYETWMMKSIADIRFLQNMLKRIKYHYVPQVGPKGIKRSRRALKVWAVLFYLGVSIPIISHISYFKGKRILEWK